MIRNPIVCLMRYLLWHNCLKGILVHTIKITFLEIKFVRNVFLSSTKLMLMRTPS